MTTQVLPLIPEIDAEFLAEKGYRYDLCQESGAVYVIINDYPLPAPFVPNQADLLIQLPAGYPNAKPDMFWTSPDVKLAGGAWPKSSEVHENKRGRSWQRWSRHFPDNRWRPGTDNLRTYLAAIRAELLKGI
jgi:hypothetical protein